MCAQERVTSDAKAADNNSWKFKSNKRGKLRAYSVWPFASKMGFFYSLNVELRGCALLRSPARM